MRTFEIFTEYTSTKVEAGNIWDAMIIYYISHPRDTIVRVEDSQHVNQEIARMKYHLHKVD